MSVVVTRRSNSNVNKTITESVKLTEQSTNVATKKKNMKNLPTTQGTKSK